MKRAPAVTSTGSYKWPCFRFPDSPEAQTPNSELCHVSGTSPHNPGTTTHKDLRNGAGYELLVALRLKYIHIYIYNPDTEAQAEVVESETAGSKSEFPMGLAFRSQAKASRHGV